MRSLTLKLALAFLAVGLAGVVLVAVIVRRQTLLEFDRFIVDQYQADVIARAGDYYTEAGEWAGVESILRGRRGPGGGGPVGGSRPVILTDTSGEVIASTVDDGYKGSMNYDGGATATTDPLPIEVEGAVVGYVQFLDMSETQDLRETAEAAFLDRMSRAILISAIGAGLLALVLGAALASTISRPVRELTDGTKALAAGDLGHQVPVRTADEIGQLAQSFNRMSADLARSTQLRKQMTADIAHDLRTPLSVILGYSEALQDDKLPGTLEIYGAMHRQAQHLNRLIEDLRTLSLADAGQLSLQRRTVQPGDLLEHAAIAYLPQAEERGIQLSVTAEATPGYLRRPDRLVQVIGNLVGNALRHTPDGGHVQLAAALAGPRVVLSVTDDGPGIPNDDLPHIFERFYRGDKARVDDGSSGLGLAIARSLVEAHGGQIGVENVASGGARFTIALPLANGNGHAAA
ncbi:MAG: HAMP domain-containing histidine kinase [Candidatus Promineofilum sp.]|nr:HAMP domain-containing histidine kinase [Promineifilum sp.]